MKQKVAMLITLGVLFSILFSIPISASTGAVHVYNQDVTAYVAASGSKTASGATPRIGYVAVHPKTWRSHTTPILPFGSTIYTTEVFNVPNGGRMNLFSVQDIGDVNNSRGLTLYFFDIYIGVNTTSNYNAAVQFGLQKTDYKGVF